MQLKYPNGSPYSKVKELFEANPEYLPKMKTITNVSNAIFGMSLGKYLESIGLLQVKIPKAKAIKKKDYIVCKVNPVGISTTLYCFSTTTRIQAGDKVEFSIGVHNCLVFGSVEEVIYCDENTLPCDIKEIKKSIRKVSLREYSSGLLGSILHAWISVTSDELINSAPAKTFRAIQISAIQPKGSVPWACIRGISSEVISVLDYLISKDNQSYEYTDIILMDAGVSELYVFADDVIDILKRFPDVKAVMFVENKDNNNVELCYSRSGYATITDSYIIGHCDLASDLKWTLKYSPTEDFSNGQVNYKFKFSDDWDAINYVFFDENASRKQLGK